ncbi:hypothetical protein N7457_002928 [Penicillium paradoxum]|uniref:uncharacterized protein n=1 Tax=Penicillium paradoxum TaxID=176176 RepID=UPI002546AD4E|nr:uncharacterized protein N7457_002928 [Penicillium paradoxum]KAJ5787938.1 hypothetical protein N7457_002928 [Penicillium paradoxum]
MPIPTRSASLREPRKQTSNIARPATKASPPPTTAAPSQETARGTNDKNRSPSNPSPVEGVSLKDNALTTRGRTLLPQRSNTPLDNGRGTTQGRFQPPSKMNPRGNPSPTRQPERQPVKNPTQLDSSAMKTAVASTRRQSIIRPSTLKMPAVKTTVPLSKTSAPSIPPPSPRKQPERRLPAQPSIPRRPQSPKKTEMLPPPRTARSSSLRQPIASDKGPPAVARVHTRNRSQLVQNTKQIEPTPVVGQRPRLLSNHQRPSSPTKFSKPPTPTPGAETKPGNLLIPSSWPDIAALQTELLQLSLFHSNSVQNHADWRSGCESRLRKQYDGIASQYRSVLADETRRQCQLNVQALSLWLSNCCEHRGPHDFSEQVQILSQILQDVSDMVSGGGGGLYCQVVKTFENWLHQTEVIRHNRGPQGVDVGIFIDPLARSWKESLYALNTKLESCARQLQLLDILGVGQVERLEQSALARAARNLAELIQLMAQEIHAMQTLEAEVVRSERATVSLLATRLAGSTREMKAPRVGAWKS